MTSRIGVPWIDRGALFALILWFIALLSFGTVMVLGPAFEHYLERLREGHRVASLKQEMRQWQEQASVLRATLDHVPESPPSSSIAEWLGRFPRAVTVVAVNVQPTRIDLTVEGLPDVLWLWVIRSIPTWSGLAPVGFSMQGAGPKVQLMLTLRREAVIRIGPEKALSEPAVLPVWGPLSDCPEFTVVSRIGRTVHLTHPSGVPQTVRVSDWVTADWQLIHVSGRTLQWRSRLGTLCHSGQTES